MITVITINLYPLVNSVFFAIQYFQIIMEFAKEILLKKISTGEWPHFVLILLDQQNSFSEFRKIFLNYMTLHMIGNNQMAHI